MAEIRVRALRRLCRLSKIAFLRGTRSPWSTSRSRESTSSRRRHQTTLPRRSTRSLVFSIGGVVVFVVIGVGDIQQRYVVRRIDRCRIRNDDYVV